MKCVYFRLSIDCSPHDYNPVFCHLDLATLANRWAQRNRFYQNPLMVKSTHLVTCRFTNKQEITVFNSRIVWRALPYPFLFCEWFTKHSYFTNYEDPSFPLRVVNYVSTYMSLYIDVFITYTIPYFSFKLLSEMCTFHFILIIINK